MIIPLNNVRLFYETAGSGPPLILLHGNGETHKIFRKAMQRLAAHFTVYAIDSRSHGQSSKLRPLHYSDMAEDIAQFITALQLEKPMLYGFSDGGILGLMLAYSYPNMLSRLAVSGANLSPAGTKSGMARFERCMYRLTRGDNWRLMLEEPDITAAQLARITIPVLVLAGEKDLIQEEHTRSIAAAIPRSRLQILSGESHGSYVLNNDKLCGIIAPFFLEDII